MNVSHARDDTQPGNGAPAQNRQITAVWIYGVALFTILITYYGGLYLLWSANSKIYAVWMKFIGVMAWEFPFLDIIAVLSWSDCHHAGYNVFEVNPCDPLGRLLSYSPVILDLPFHWLGVQNATKVGLSIDLAYLAILPVLFRPDSIRALGIAILACLSPAVLFAVERANLDVFVMMLIAGCALLATCGPMLRLASYVVYIATGLLKIYPFVLLGLIVRERPRVALVYGSVAAAFIATIAMFYWGDLMRALGHRPAMVYFGDTFGGILLPLGLTRFFRLPSAAGGLIFVLFLIMSALVACRLARRLHFSLSMMDWNGPSIFLLVVGSILTVSCFVTGMNIGYRVSILLFVIPGLLELKIVIRDCSLRRVITYTFVAVFYCLWRQFIESGLFSLGLVRADSLSGFLFFLVREAVWWSLVSVLSVFIVLYVLHSPVWRVLTARRVSLTTT